MHELLRCGNAKLKFKIIKYNIRRRCYGESLSKLYNVDIDELEKLVPSNLEVECIGECGQHEGKILGHINDELKNFLTKLINKVNGNDW